MNRSFHIGVSGVRKRNNVNVRSETLLSENSHYVKTPIIVSSKMDRLKMYCQHLIISIVPLNLLMKQKVVTSYPS